MKLEFFSDRFSKNTQNLNFHEIPSSGSQVVTCGQSARHDEPDSRFSQICERARQGQQFVLKPVGNTVDVLPVPHDIWVAAEWDRTVTHVPPAYASVTVDRLATYTLRTRVATTVLPRISKSATSECVKEAGLLYTFSKHRGLRESGRVWSVYYTSYHIILYHIIYSIVQYNIITYHIITYLLT